MSYKGVRAQGSSWVIRFHTAAADGGAESFSATIEVADFDIYKGTSATQRSSTAGFAIAETFDSVVGLHVFSADMNDNTDAGFYSAGADLGCALTPDETLDTQTVAAWIGECDIETNGGLGVRRLSDIHAAHTVGATGNTTSAMHASFLPASLGDDEVNGELWAWYDVSEDDWLLIEVTDYTASSQVAAIQLWSTKAAAPVAPASGDYCFRAGIAPLRATVPGRTIDAAADGGFEGDASTDIQTAAAAAITAEEPIAANVTQISGDATAADNLEALMDGVLVAAVNDASATTTAFAADGFTEATDDHFNGRLITFTSGANLYEQTDITDYDAAGHAQGNQALVVTAMTAAPGNNDTFIIH